MIHPFAPGVSTAGRHPQTVAGPLGLVIQNSLARAYGQRVFLDRFNKACGVYSSEGLRIVRPRARGSLMIKVLPLPGADSTSMMPRWFLVMMK